MSSTQIRYPDEGGVVYNTAKAEAKGAKSERERIANLLAPRGCQCCPYPKALCNTTDNCFDCWIKYLNDTPGEG